MNAEKKKVFRYIIGVFLLSLLFAFFTFDELQRREKFSISESRSLAGVQKVAEFVFDYQKKQSSGVGDTSPSTDLTAIAAAVAPLLKSLTPPIEIKSTEDAAQDFLKQRYDNFAREHTLTGFPYYPINRVDNLPLLAIFLCLLGIVSSSFGTLVLMARGRYADSETKFDLFNLWLMPVFGGVTSVITGLVLFFSTKSDLKILSGLNIESTFVSVPVPIYILSFWLSLNPLNTLTALFSFLRNHWSPFGSTSEEKARKE